MRRKVGLEYNTARGRSRDKVKRIAIEQEDSESASSVSDEDDEDFAIEDNEYHDEEYDSTDHDSDVTRRQRKMRSKRTSNCKWKGIQKSGDHQFATDEEEGKDDDDDAPPRRRSARRSLRVAQSTRSTNTGPDSGEDMTVGGGIKRKNHRNPKRAKSTDSDTPINSRSSSRRSTRLSSARRQEKVGSESVGDILGALPSPRSTGKLQRAVQARNRSTKLSNEESRDSDFDDDDNSVATEDNGGRKDDSEYDEEKEEKVNNTLPKMSKNKVLGCTRSSTKKKIKQKKTQQSSDEEFVLDSDDDDSSQDLSLSDDSDANLMEDDNEILMIGDPDLSDEESDHENIKDNGKANNHAANAVNIDNENIGTIDDDDDDDVPSEHQRPKKNRPPTRGNEILPSPKSTKNNFESDSDPSDQDTAAAKSRAISCIGLQLKCLACPSTEDAITLEPLSRRHVCYVVPDGKSRQCFNLGTLRQIVLKSSQLELRVDIDGERQNFLQPPAFRTPMSDDLVDQIASKFGRGALDLHGAYYKNRDSKEHSKNDQYKYEYDSDSSGENIYNSLATLRERIRDYFNKGMGSQDIYVCPLCYDQIHRSIANPKENDDDDDDEDEDNDDSKNDGNVNDTAPCDSIIDPMMVLGHLDNDEMYMASRFCFKKLADVKKHLREEHNVDTRGIQGNDLYKRFRVRAPDGLLQRWLSTQVRGHVKQGDMRIYWYEGHSQTYIQLLDLIEQADAYCEGVDDDSSDASKAREFFRTFATRASDRWKMLSSPFLKSNENINDFIANDNDCIEDISIDDKQPHAFLHQQFINGEDSDENDFAHKLQRKYVDVNEESESSSSSTEEELEIEGHVNEEPEDTDEDNQCLYNRNGYYSPVEEETDEWMLKLQSQRRRKGSQQKKKQTSSAEVQTPVGKRLFRRKTTPTATSSSTSGASKKRRKFTIEDSSDDDIL